MLAAKVQFCLKVIQLLDTLLENFSSGFFLTQSMAALFAQLNELFLLYADLYLLVSNSSALDTPSREYIEHYLALLSSLLEEEQFAKELLANKDLMKKVDALALKDDSLVAANANIAKYM
jgi:hypothetical protein